MQLNSFVVAVALAMGNLSWAQVQAHTVPNSVSSVLSGIDHTVNGANTSVVTFENLLAGVKAEFPDKSYFAQLYATITAYEDFIQEELTGLLRDKWIKMIEETYGQPISEASETATIPSESRDTTQENFHELQMVLARYRYFLQVNWVAMDWVLSEEPQPWKELQQCRARDFSV